jgi:hypothetical protein
MTPKPDDRARLDFIASFRVALTFDHDSRLWLVEMAGGYRTLGKTPRQAVDEAMRWTRRNTNAS